MEELLPEGEDEDDDLRPVRVSQIDMAVVL